MKISYTETGKSQLEIFKNEQAKKLEKIIVRDKSYPGIEAIEITGSDIQKYAKDIDFYRKNNKRRLFRFFVLLLYFLLGLTCIFGGLFYNQLKYLAQNEPEEAVLIIIGFFFTIFSVFAAIYFRYKDNLNNSKNIIPSHTQLKEIIKIQEEELAHIDQIYKSLQELNPSEKDIYTKTEC